MDGLHGFRLTVRTRTPTGETDEFGQPQYEETRRVLDGCNVQPLAAADLPLFQDANHVPQYKCFGPVGMLVAGLLTGDSRIEWDGRVFQPVSAAFDYRTPDGVGDHTEWWMTEVVE